MEKKFILEESKKIYLPMCHSFTLSKCMCPKTDEELQTMTLVPYASAICSILYCMISTKPDIDFAPSFLGRY